MPRKSQKAKLILDKEQKEQLQKISQSRKRPVREAQRAGILLRYSEGIPITGIEEMVRVSRPTIYKWIERALAMGIDEGLKDKYHRPKEPVITQEAKAWVINLACKKPTDYGYAAETWTRSALADHARKYAPEAGHDCLKKAAKATVQRILDEHPIRPHKMAYYLERRDPEFEQKMVDILCVYKEVNLQNGAAEPGDIPSVITVSVDEKPGVQAIKNIAPDIMPEPGKQSRVIRDYEYKRLGTLSILAALDLHDGHVIAQVHDKHRSSEFISLLKEMDAYYPAESTIRIILDNHSAHISKETMKYLAGIPGRFVYVHTPKHGSWLNLVETLFGKMARTFLKHIRVNSKQELKERILLGIKEINDSPVVHRWKKFDFAHAF
ncbi:integrase [Peptococcaceae bacterium SCADC1_2_3]|nr:integrase [Peptococcaceae bacterium SCADC1_2_3]KFI38198.1 integrase [Peptococcaceae bacterium SCADC1_2_3]